jgi:hypothetical protein
MMDFFRNAAYEVVAAGNDCFSVSGNHAWAGEEPTFFVPAAKLKIGRIFSVLGCLARLAVAKIRQVCWRQERREGRFIVPGVAETGRLVARRL